MIRLTIFFTAVLLISCTQKSTSDLISPPISSSDTLINRLKTESIGAIFEDSKGNLWLAGSHLYRVSNDTILSYSTNDGLASNWIIDIQEDEAGNIYFDSPDGLSRFDGNKFSAIPIASGNDLDTSWQLNPSDLWFTLGWEHDGPFRYDGEFLHPLTLSGSPEEAKFKAVHPNPPYNPYGLYTIYQDANQHVWMGTSSLGICRFDGKTLSWLFEEHHTYTPDGGSFGIRSILQDSKGFYWFCSPTFKYEIHPELKKNGDLSYSDYSILRATVGKLSPIPYFPKMIEHESALWGITYFNGVYRIHENEVENYPIEIKGEAVHLQTMHTTASGEILVGTKEHGVYQFDGQVFIPKVFGK